MNDLTTAAVERLTAQMGEALFGEPGLSLMEIANRRAEIEQMAKDAGRWGYARRILDIGVIEDCQRNACRNNNYAAESESVKADKAIDAAMKEQAE